MSKYFITGGCGFIGSHLVRRLLENPETGWVTVYDNLSVGKRGNVPDPRIDLRLKIIVDDIENTRHLTEAMAGHDIVYHFVANADIAKSESDPTIDFRLGTALMQDVLEAMRANGIKRLYYASGSGVYGDYGSTEVDENAVCRPISTYGASKLACESLIHAYSHMFGFNAAIFRFANVVGPRQTHGVGYDFLRQLKANPDKIHILGDGQQSKSYVHVDDVMSAFTCLPAMRGSFVYNVANIDYLDVETIAAIAVELMGNQNTLYSYSGGTRGWRGDVPIVRFNSNKIRYYGWKAQRDSYHAMLDAMLAMKEELCSTS